jgi:hypothetical protein
MAQDSIDDNYSESQKAAGVGTFAAATVLWAAGVLKVFQGISVLTDDELIVPLPDYVYGFTATISGWIHIILGVLIAVVALGLFWLFGCVAGHRNCRGVFAALVFARGDAYSARPGVVTV